MQNRYQAYRQVEVNTANRGKIVVMLYSGAITFLKKAIKATESKDFYKKGNFINKAQDIIDELNYSLDMQKGKDIAKNLRSLYLFMGRFLNQANIENDTEKITRIVNMLIQLKLAFEQVLESENDEVQILNRKEMIQSSIKRYV